MPHTEQFIAQIFNKREDMNLYQWSLSDLTRIFHFPNLRQKREFLYKQAKPLVPIFFVLSYYTQA